MVQGVEGRNPTYNSDGITVDLEINHPVFGWIEFTASPNDPENHGKVIYQACISGQFGPIVGA